MVKLKPLEILMALMVPLVWGMGFVFAKGAINHFPPILLMAFRFALTAMVLVWFVPVPYGNLKNIFNVAIVAAAIQYSLTFTGLAGLEAGLASLVVQLEVPFLVLLGALVLKENPGLQKWAGIIISFLGVGLMTQQNALSGSLGSVCLVVAGCFVWACGQVMIRKLKDIGGLQVTAWVAVFATPQLFIMSAIFETGQLTAIQNANHTVWLTVIYLGLVMTCFGYYLWNTLIRRHDVGTVAPFLLLLPLFSLMGGMLFLGEEPTADKLLGGVVILLGVAIITINLRHFINRKSPSD
ncbi:MAG: EamA family transporter [Alphaproteobacteria bacterium]|jgi:O-acetylserine/cysteine efflux transporter|nr:EamA family transporter [Alphaproteobacteria bacterium]